MNLLSRSLTSTGWRLTLSLGLLVAAAGPAAAQGTPPPPKPGVAAKPAPEQPLLTPESRALLEKLDKGGDLSDNEVKALARWAGTVVRLVTEKEKACGCLGIRRPLINVGPIPAPPGPQATAIQTLAGADVLLQMAGVKVTPVPKGFTATLP